VTYGGQDKSNGLHWYRLKHICEKNTFVTFILKPHSVDSLLDDRVVVYPLSRSVSAERLRGKTLYTISRRLGIRKILD
jgi:hypothetical protein